MSASYRRDARGGLERSRFTVFIAAVSLALLAYSVARAAKVPLTYDEAVTYQWYIDTDPLSVLDLSSATNHLLNTLLMRLASWVGGDREVVLRAPSLLGHALYLLFSFLILRAIRYRVVAAAGFLLLNLNPYVVDYFSLGRGYGLALGLLMGAVYFLVRLIACTENPADAPRYLARTLLLGGLAVAANASLLLAYLGVWTVGLAIVILRHRQEERRAQPADQMPPGTRAMRRVVWLPLAAALFTGVVLAQDEELSSSLYEPISVRIAGLFDHELDEIAVQRLDMTSRWRPLRREGDTWRTESVLPVGALRVELPAAAARNFALIAVTIGSTTFRHERRSPGPWTANHSGRVNILESDASLSLPRATVPSMRRAINWRSDTQQALLVVAGVGVALAVVTLLFAVLWAAGWILARLAVLDRASWRVLAQGMLWMAVLLGSSVYVQSRNAMFYFGGQSGLVPDTYASLVTNSFHGATYHQAQTRMGLTGIALSVVTFVVLALMRRRRAKDFTLVTAGAMLALLTIASGLASLQHTLIGTPYLMARTALFLVPLYGCFFVFLCAAIADTHAFARPMVASSLTVVVLLAAYHFAATASLTHVFDWPKDADTRQMIADVQRAAASGQAAAAHIRLGVQADYYPVAVFYAKHSTPAIIEIDVLPAERPVDYLYVESGSVNGEGRVMATYPRSRSVLVHAERPDQPIPTPLSR